MQPILGQHADDSVDSASGNHDVDPKPQSIRDKVDHITSSWHFNRIVLGILIFDLVLVFAEITVALITCSQLEEHAPSIIEHILEAAGIITLVILALFMVEISVRLWASRGRHWKMEVLDLVVVTVAFVLELVYRSLPRIRELVQVLVILRLWRVIRLVVTTGEAYEIEFKHRVKQLRKYVTKLEAAARIQGADIRRNPEVDRLLGFHRKGRQG